MVDNSHSAWLVGKLDPGTPSAIYRRGRSGAHERRHLASVRPDRPPHALDRRLCLLIRCPSAAPGGIIHRVREEHRPDGTSRLRPCWCGARARPRAPQRGQRQRAGIPPLGGGIVADGRRLRARLPGRPPRPPPPPPPPPVEPPPAGRPARGPGRGGPPRRQDRALPSSCPPLAPA